MTKAQIKEQMSYWKISGERNWKATETLFKNKHYDACLFFCHLSIEKLLKGLVVRRTKDYAPYIHDLAELAKKAELNSTAIQLEDLKIITTFNIAGRYDEAKFSFYRKCTQEYTKKYQEISKKLILWLEKEYQKK
ncbi:MAG: HEPN domain-containing protein [bacterium]